MADSIAFFSHTITKKEVTRSRSRFTPQGKTIFYHFLKSPIPQASWRRIAWADREQGYIDIIPYMYGKGEGYVRGSLCRLKDILWVDGGGRPHHADEIVVRPGEIELSRTTGERLRYALLFETGCMWLSVEVQKTPAKKANTKNTPKGYSKGVGLILPDLAGPWHSLGTQEGWFIYGRDAQASHGLLLREATEEVAPSPEAIAIVGNAPFTVDQAKRREIRPSVAPEGYGVYHIFPPLCQRNPEQKKLRGSNLQYYIAWGSTLEEAINRALQAAQKNCRLQHQQRIATFFQGFSWDTGDPLVNKAIGWTAFSGWSLVTRVEGKGIWAGLPWFRDNWGRDTFIALPGILLVSGQFQEAREIIATFGGWQDTNPTSPTYGRVPNRWRSPQDVMYNTVDGTLWFIREVWEYGHYTGDTAFLRSMAPVVFRALDADMARCDTFHFLLHDHADTWMDARIQGEAPWSERGSRGVEVQALWFTALCCGAALAHLIGDVQRETLYRNFAQVLKENFHRYFWYPRYGRLADRLLPQQNIEAPTEREADLRCRPNGLIALLATAILPREEQLLPEEIWQQIVGDAVQNLLYPYGIASLSQEDPLFHPHHEWPRQYHKDAAYHNGTIWQWNAGAVIYGLLRFGKLDLAWLLTQELSRQSMQDGAVGTLGENLHAHPSADGRIIHSGTYSQAWSVSEFSRSIFQDWLGIHPRLLENKIIVASHLPPGQNHIAGTQQAGRWQIFVDLSKTQNYLLYTIELNQRELPDKTLTADVSEAPLEGQDVLVSYQPSIPPILELQVAQGGTLRTWVFQIEPGTPYHVEYNLETTEFCVLSTENKKPAPLQPETTRHLFNPSLIQNVVFCTPRLPPWNLPSRYQHALEMVVLKGTYTSGPVSILKEWYNSADFARHYHTDEPLGALYSRAATEFKVWSPVATEVMLCLYEKGNDGTPFKIVPMDLLPRGVWTCRVTGDLHGVYYTYRLRIFSIWRETIDPYAVSAGVNGERGMVVDFSRLEPASWEDFEAPSLAAPTDAIIWEVHIRDLTCHITWNGPEALRGTFIGATTTGTSYRNASETPIPTGFDYIRELGITHVQLLPIFDFVSVDEQTCQDPAYRTRKEGGVFNWGYDPGNYLVPEGSYATNPFDGSCRVRELRELIVRLGHAGIGVIMDVVYNHVPDMRRSALEACVPGYYFRGRRDSSAGDDTASERYMFRKYMKDSLIHWLTTYKLCGFRFDLMGLHDIQTMREIEATLRSYKPDILLYGEGWDMYGLSQPIMASQRNIHLLKGIGMFNDAFRDGVKGSVFHEQEGGWIHGESSWKESVQFGLIGAVRHPQVHNKKVIGTARPQPWSEQTWKSINYIEVHDNLTLFDKLQLVEPGKTQEYYARLQRLAITLLFCSQGIVLLHAGIEFLRTKEVPLLWIQDGGIDKCVAMAVPNPSSSGEKAGSSEKRFFCHDSYKAGDLLNSLNWERAYQHWETVQYVRGLVALRKGRKALRLTKGSTVRRALRFLPAPEGVLVWYIDGKKAGDPKGSLYIAANSTTQPVLLALPQGHWELLADSGRAFIQGGIIRPKQHNGMSPVLFEEKTKKENEPAHIYHYSNQIKVSPKSCMILQLCRK
ncbi:MAG: type I pullulanase [Treponemataceae bacterium]|nr:type I pullulanase [Treponemataceae bacterium]